MPKRTDIKKILIIGSGPIVIGQACEFDYSGSQACKVLKKEGYKIVLVNSNPATIMTDPEMADRTYIEPLTVEILEKIIKKERPDALIPTLGGQTGLNLAVALAEKGIAKKHSVEYIGADYETIRKAEDRNLFKKIMSDNGIDLPKSGYAKDLKNAKKIAEKIGFPCIIRPSFTLGGTGGSIANDKDEFFRLVKRGLATSPVNSVLIEESVIGWKEYELEVMRDRNDNVVIVCSIENLDPMGVHTGDSITVAPQQTLSDKEYQNMRDIATKVMRAIGVETGGSNIQFAVEPKTGRMVVIEMNPRVSRSSALASKATGFPIAKIASQLAVGYTLDEISNDITKKTPASFEPSIDYVVTKVPRFAFEKFLKADDTLGISMKSIGEVMAIGRTFKESLQKAIRGLEIGRYGLGGDGKGQVPIVEKLKVKSKKLKEREEYIEQVKHKLETPNCDRIFNIKYGLQLGLSVDEISELSRIDKWFIYQIKEIVGMENIIKNSKLKIKNSDFLKKAKQYGFSDYQIGYLTGKKEIEIRNLRKKLKIIPTYKMVDTCAGEFEASTPYFYSTYENEDENIEQKNRIAKEQKKIMILGGGPNRIGQGIEFDYCCVHASFALKEEGYKTIMVNCNPETVSTDYDTSDILYFEPLTLEDILNITEKEKPDGTIVQYGGQTPLNFVKSLQKMGVKIIGTSPLDIDIAEDRKKFGNLLKKLKIPHAEWGTATSYKEALKVTERIGYPVIVRPSYVLGGRAMEVVYDDLSLNNYINRATEISPFHPVLIDKFLSGAIEIDVDAVSDSKEVFIGGIMEHIEEAGIHSGDSACLLPPYNLSNSEIETIKKYTRALAFALNVKGLLNIQFAIRDGLIYVLEVNPRASRTVPFVSKVAGIPLAKVGAKVMVGKKLQDLLKMDFDSTELNYTGVKEAVMPFLKFPGVDIVLGPEMKSTGEVMGIDRSFEIAFAKSQMAAGSSLPLRGSILVSVKDSEKKNILPIVEKFVELGFDIYGTKNTSVFLNKRGIKTRMVFKIGKGKSDIVDVIKNHTISLIINIPSGKGSYSDGFMIRTTGLVNNIPIITTISAAKATVKAIAKLKNENLTVRPIQDYY